MSALRVLLVDDEEELVSALKERLDLRGIAVDGVLRGKDALALVEEKDFDVVVLDIKMPDMSGLEVLKRIKELRPEVPVIMFTGHVSSETTREGMDAGACDYLVKPIDIEELVEKIKLALG